MSRIAAPHGFRFHRLRTAAALILNHRWTALDFVACSVGFSASRAGIL